MNGISPVSRMVVLGAVVMLVALGCNSGNRQDEPFTRPMNVSSPQMALGQRVFFSTCNQCHPSGSAGYGKSLNARLMPDLYIRARVRDGLGGMPSFDEKQISNEELDAVVAYVQGLHELQ